MSLHIVDWEGDGDQDIVFNIGNYQQLLWLENKRFTRNGTHIVANVTQQNRIFVSEARFEVCRLVEELID